AARLIWKAGTNCHGWFGAEDLLKQVKIAIDLFEAKTNGWAVGLWIFDNAPSHQRRAADALSARRMPKGPKAGWTHRKDGPKMQIGTFPDGSSQALYFPDHHPVMPGWFKGMEQIIRERNLWPANGLKAQCDGFKCPSGQADCCCPRLLFTQPDFIDQKSQLEEYITSRGHLCDYYPKYHCELNFIEQYWGHAKMHYHTSPQTSDINEMEQIVLRCLDNVSLLYANRSARFISAYAQGLSGAEAVWANRKYHGHRTLPPALAAELKREARK
ncbi:hypothetical protein WOLCODRAFT_84904, partial [Wolfiporia cocos MD-104 SS10]